MSIQPFFRAPAQSPSRRRTASPSATCSTPCTPAAAKASARHQDPVCRRRARPSRAGFDARRVCDFMAQDLWTTGDPSPCTATRSGSPRSDWLRELRDPAKAEEFRRYCDRWWLVVSDCAIVKPGELPTGWGLLARRAARCGPSKGRTEAHARAAVGDVPRGPSCQGGPRPTPDADSATTRGIPDDPRRGTPSPARRAHRRAVHHLPPRASGP